MRAVAETDRKPLADVKLIDQDGKNIKLHDFKGHYVFMTFVFTRCPMPEMCPRTLALVKDLINQWKTLPRWKQKGFPLKAIAVTLDPEHDTPAAMKDYAAKLGLDFEYFSFVTGDPKDLKELAAQFNVIGIESDGTISHVVKAALMNPLMLPLREYKDNNWNAEQVLRDMRQSVAWWKWFFVLSAALAIPGLLLLWWLRSYKLEANSEPIQK
jgi:protein SCO1/2